MLRDEKKLSGFLKLSLSLVFLGSSYHAVCSEYAPGFLGKLETGRRQLTEKEINVKIQNLPLTEKKLLAAAQLNEILPPILFSSVPNEILEKVDFSCADDGWARSEKFLKLALSLNDFEDTNDKEFLIATAYSSAAVNLESLNQIPAHRLWEYHINLAQYKSWAGFHIVSCMGIDKALKYFLESIDHLDEAELALHHIKTVDLEEFKSFVNTYIDGVPETELQQLGEDALTKLSLMNEEEMDEYRYQVLQLRLKAKEANILKMRPDLQDRVRQNYKNAEIQRLDSRLPKNSYESKINTIKKQNLLTNYNKLVNLGYVPSYEQDMVKAKGYLDYIDFLNQYGYLKIFGMNFKETILLKIDSERGRLKNYLNSL